MLNNTTDLEITTENINDLILKHNAVVFAFLALVIIFGIVGNGFSFAYYGFVEKKTVTSFLITILAANDLLSSVIFVDQIIALRYLLDFQSRFGCSLIRFLDTLCIVNSLSLLSPIGIDRCLKICVNNPRYHLTRSKAVILTGSLILFSFVRAVRQFFTSDIKSLDVQIAGKNAECKICTTTEEKAMTTVVQIFDRIDNIAFLSVNVVLICVYLLMVRKVTQVRRRINAYPSRSHPSENKATSLSGQIDTLPNNKKFTIEKQINLGSGKVVKTHESVSLQTSTTHLDVSNLLSTVTETSTASISSELKDGIHTSAMDSSRIVLSKGESQLSLFERDHQGTNVGAAGNERSKPLPISHFTRDDHVSKHRDDTSNKNAFRLSKDKIEIKLNIMLTVMTFSSLFSYVPYIIVAYFLDEFEMYTKYSLNALVQIAWRCPLLNSTMNPYVIGLFNSSFRQFVKRVLRIHRR